jgi:hypothetical protein
LNSSNNKDIKRGSFFEVLEEYENSGYVCFRRTHKAPQGRINRVVKRKI